MMRKISRSNFGLSFRKKPVWRSITIASRGLNSTTLNGPEPTGRLFFGWVLMSWPSPNTCLGMIGQNAGDSASRIAGCGALSRITAINGDGVSTRSTGSNIDWNGWLALIVMIENATSSLVIGLPS